MYIITTRTYQQSKEQFVDFNVHDVLSKLTKVKDIDTTRKENDQYFMNTKNTEIKTKSIHVLSIMNILGNKLNSIIDLGIFKVEDFHKKIKNVYELLLKTFRIIFKIIEKCKSIDNLNTIVKVLVEYIKNEIGSFDVKYEKLKSEWDMCFDSNGIARYVGLNNHCERAYKNTQKFRKELAELPGKIVEKYNDLQIKLEHDKVVNLQDIKTELHTNKEIFEKSLDNFKIVENMTYNLNNQANDTIQNSIDVKELEEYKKKLESLL
jgi:hypothetical protein